MEQIIFYFISGITVLSALFFVFSRNPLYAILSLIVTFFSIAGLYVLLNAQFLAIVQVIVYAGAIMVLFLYILMMLNLNKENESKKHVFYQCLGVLATGILFLGILSAYKGITRETFATDADPSVGLTENLGKLLFNEYVLPFEFASILILAGIVSVVLVGKKDL
ncbi:MAG: NADH-quinone oxidoreductase subunit J [Bergeyella sp.]|nr:NADH-quinone oxidoreductase subunit J [Bergeyella sp.]